MNFLYDIFGSDIVHHFVNYLERVTPMVTNLSIISMQKIIV